METVSLGNTHVNAHYPIADTPTIQPSTPGAPTIKPLQNYIRLQNHIRQFLR